MRRRAGLGVLLLWAACRTTSFQTAQPSLQLSATSLDFGSLPVLNSKSLPLTLTDVGEADLSVSSIAITPADGTFALQGTPPTSVPGGGGAQTLTLVFTPPQQQTYQATLTLQSDDPTHPSATVTLTGTGSTAGQLTVSPDPVDFGQVGEGQTALQQLTLSSVGTAPLTLDAIALTDGGDPSFSIVGSTKTPVQLPNTPPDDTAVLTLRFSPTAQTPLEPQGGLLIQSTDPSQPNLVVPLQAQMVRAPVCELADPGTVAVGAQVTLDGGASYDPGGNGPLTYQWAMTSKPAGSGAVLANTAGAYPSLLADTAGNYSFSLGVTNALGVSSLQPCTATLTARPADDLYIEMFWDDLTANMDLHFLAPGGTFASAATDCNGQNQNPSGFAATCSDDHLTGPGPEWAEMATPAPGTYTVDVVYFSTNTPSNTAPCNVTVRVYEYGVVTAVLTRQLTQQGQLWEAATIDWPTGTVTPGGADGG